MKVMFQATSDDDFDAKPWLICQTKLARFLEVSCKILQDNALFLQKIAKILQKMKEMQDLGRFLQELSDLFIFQITLK